MYYSTSILFGNPQKKMSFFIEEAPDLLAQYREGIRPNGPSVLIGIKQGVLGSIKEKMWREANRILISPIFKILVPLVQHTAEV